MWDVQTGQELKKFEGHSISTIYDSITVSSDGKYLITRDFDNVLYWNVETGLQLSELPPSASFNENEATVRQINGIHVEIKDGIGFTEDFTTHNLSLHKGTYFGPRDKDIVIWTTVF